MTHEHHQAPTERFSDRVDDYVRYRPGYPPQVVALLRELTGLAPGWRVADIGSGTGISTAVFLDGGHEVFAVEPNDEMREAAEARLGTRAGFHSVAGTAEATGLASGSIDLVVAAQAFHWFDRDAARSEMERILRPEGWVALIWNVRQTETSDFLRELEALLLDYSIDYARVRHENVTDEVVRTFLPRDYGKRTVEHAQDFDLDGLRGRIASASYVPAPGHPAHGPLFAELEQLFERRQNDGRVRIAYDAVVHAGRL
ncbi:MAG: methyltransferase domain-containing protein [Acidobacteria bacterium]|nr:methyltransferase domain-containing protein [Acidobacteriota bacterium]